MKIKITQTQKAKQDKAFRRVKWSGFSLLLFGSVTYFATSLSERMDSYVQFVDAQNELIIEQSPLADLDEEGYLAMADFQAWYGMDDFEDLDEEYASVKRLIANTSNLKEETPKALCADEKTEVGKHAWGAVKDFQCKGIQYRPNGYVEEYYSEQQCYSGMILIPGIQLLPTRMLAATYFVFLMYLFLGIAIIADIFMEAIEVITSTTQRKEVWDKTGKKKFYIEQPVWNATIANLSLMALGSSAPEILLSVLETVGRLGKEAGELGPSTIVGSAAFNLLFISAVCIPSVDEPKKIADMGVFGTTAIFSLFAYLWLYYCLEVSSRGTVTRVEAWITLSFFLLLLVLAFGADKFHQYKVNKAKDLDEIEEDKRKIYINAKKTRLREIAHEVGNVGIIEVAHGTAGSNVSREEQKEITDLLCEVMGVTKLHDCSVNDIHAALLPDSQFERFAARKAVGMGNTKDFLSIKGSKNQVGQEDASKSKGSRNQNLHFKCLHYSVTESSGYVDVCVQKVNAGEEFSFGIRTVDNTARQGSEYEALNKIINFRKNEDEKSVPIKIFDNSDWQPDLEFAVELYDPSAQEMDAYEENDTRCRIVILDEDFPGTLGFEETSIRVSKEQKFVELEIVRVDGSDGKIACHVRSEPATATAGLNARMAQEFDDFVPINHRVEFGHGEQSRSVKINLVNKSLEKLGQFLEQSKKFEWNNDPVNRNANVIFGGSGELNTTMGGGTWEVIDHETIKLLVGKTEYVLKCSYGGQQWSLIKPARANVTMTSVNKSIFYSMEEPLEEDLMLRIALERPEPQGVKMSRKNIALITITPDDMEEEQTDHAKLIEYYFAEQNPTWGSQFTRAIKLGPTVDEDNFLTEVTFGEALSHFLTITWKVLFALVPPTKWGGGWPAFLCALSFIGGVTAIVGEVASMFGCVLGMPDSVTAITFVALGTSLPDTFASMTAAKQSETADSAISNVTGSNSVNVFLGLGLPWVIASTYQESYNDAVYETPPGDLAYSVTVFLICSVTCFCVLLLRRKVIGGELGGPRNSAWGSCFFLISLWFIYIILSIIKATSKKVE